MALNDESRARYVGKTLHDVPTPSAVLDLAKLETNCQQMLDAVERLSLSWRAHIKTHKTTELTRLQVGDAASSPAHIVVSTIVEAENIVPLLQEYQKRGRDVNVLYGFPLYASVVDRLAQVSLALGPGGLSLMVDHPSQIQCVEAVSAKSGIAPLVFVKVDMGYGRAGVVPNTPECAEVIDAVVASSKKGHCSLHAVYAHAGHSYDAREDGQALDYLSEEFRALEEVGALVKSKLPSEHLTLSVGATPTATSLQNPGISDKGDGVPGGRNAVISNHLQRLKAAGYEVEVHAGVYPTLDLQQLATHARDGSLLSASSIGISILCEVASLYPRRGPHETTEALINAGCLALGREPCSDMGAEKGQHYSGWGIVMPWGVANAEPGPDFPAVHGGWQVGKISQEHGILRWRGSPEDQVALEAGQRVRIWPNHSCIAGSGYDKYFVIDSRREGKEDEIVDVWSRWRGW